MKKSPTNSKKLTYKQGEVVIKFVKHYHINDEECKEDYYDSEIIVNDKIFVTLGGYDAEHDPCDYFDGFVDGVKFLDKLSKKKLDVLQIEYEHKADYDQC